jgi:hypothetical protein
MELILITEGNTVYSSGDTVLNNLYHTSNTGESPLDIAKKKGYRSIISKLRRALMESKS